MHRQEYSASLDIRYKIITIATFVLFAGLTANIFWQMSQTTSRSDIWILSGVLAVLILVLAISFLFSPRKYSIHDHTLIIHRLMGNIEIKLWNIKEVEKLDRKDIRGAIRSFGVGGLFGSFGKFYKRKYGFMNFYITQNKNLILIHTKNGKKYLISPDDISLAERLIEKK